MLRAKLKLFFGGRRVRSQPGSRGGGRLLVGAAAAVLLPQVAGAAPAPDGLNYAGVHLGMTMAAWKALPPPKTLPATATPTCETSAGATVCGYFSHYGRFALPEVAEIGPKLHGRRLRFTFVNGRLSSIAYQASIDVFNDLTARLNARYGRASFIARDNVKTPLGEFPRVREDWRTPEGQIELIDPVPPFTDLSVRLSTAQKPSARES